MAIGISIEGVIDDDSGDPVPGLTVELERLDTGFVESTTTDASGYFFLQEEAPGSADSYRANPQGDLHHSDPGEGPYHAWDGSSDDAYTDNFTTTVSNTDPTMGSIADPTYNADSGVQSETGSLSDADGDDLTIYKDSGPSWGSIVKVSDTEYRWDFDTGGVNGGDYTFSGHVEDDFGGSSTAKSVTVTIESANTPPTIDDPGFKSYEKDTGDQAFQLTASDPDESIVNLTFDKVSGPSFGSVTSIGGVTIRTNDAPEGDHDFTWRVTDSSGATDTVTHTVRIGAGATAWPFMSPIA